MITGTPGVGKSHLAKVLARKLGFLRLDLHPHYKELSIEYNRVKGCYDLDYTTVDKFVRTYLAKHKKDVVLDSHIAHLLAKSLVDLCIVLTCSDLKLLEKRLKARRYSKKKVEENLDVERLQVCLGEALEHGHTVASYETTEKDFEKRVIVDIHAWKSSFTSRADHI